MSNLQSLYSPLTIQPRQQQTTDRSNTDSKQVVTERTQRTYSVQGEGNKLQYSIEKASYSGDQSFQSPYSWKLGKEISGLENKINKSASQHISYNTAYGAESISPIIGNQTYRTYRSPSDKVTAFDATSLGYKDSFSQYNPTSKLNEAKSSLKYIDSTSEIQQQLYKNPQQTTTKYHYQNIINNQYGKQVNKIPSGMQINTIRDQRTYSGKLSPVNQLAEGNKNNDYHSQFFHYYSGANNNVGNMSISKPITPQQNYQTKINTGNNVNKYETNISTYKPLLASTQYDQYYTTIRQNKQTVVAPLIYPPSTQHATYQHQQSHYLPQSNYQSLQSVQNQYSEANQGQINTKTSVNKQMYTVIDEIQRPVYDKLYTNKQQNRRMIVEKDPPRSNVYCGPILWIPLLLLGLLLAVFGMLCGLGVICPDGAVLRQSQTKEYIGKVQPPVVPVVPVPVSPIQTVRPQQTVVDKNITTGQLTPGYVAPPVIVPPSVITQPQIDTAVVINETAPTIIPPPPSVQQIIEFEPQVIDLMIYKIVTTSETVQWNATNNGTTVNYTNIDYSSKNNNGLYGNASSTYEGQSMNQPSLVPADYYSQTSANTNTDYIATTNVTTAPLIDSAFVSEESNWIDPHVIAPIPISTVTVQSVQNITTNQTVLPDLSQSQYQSQGYVLISQQTVTKSNLNPIIQTPSIETPYVTEPQIPLQQQMHIEPQVHIQPSIDFEPTQKIETTQQIEPQMHIQPQVHIEPTVTYTTTTQTSYKTTSTESTLPETFPAQQSSDDFNLTPTQSTDLDADTLNTLPMTQPTTTTYQQPTINQQLQNIELTTTTTQQLVNPIHPSNVYVSPSFPFTITYLSQNNQKQMSPEQLTFKVISTKTQSSYKFDIQNTDTPKSINDTNPPISADQQQQNPLLFPVIVPQIQ